MRKKLIAIVILVSSLYGLIIWKRNKNNKQTLSQQKPYTSERVIQKTLKQKIRTTGTLTIKDMIKVGSLVSGTVTEILVREGDTVTAGQKLAQLDNGLGDTKLRQAEGRLHKAHAQAEYYTKQYNRLKPLAEQHLISESNFDQITRDYKSACGEHITAHAARDQEQIIYDNQTITAPGSGTIVDIGIRRGMRVTTDLNATVLFSIAPDTKQMEAELDIDESEVNLVHTGQIVRFSVDSYPGRRFTGTVTQVSFIPKRTESGFVYPATLAIDNTDQLLRPGMTINGTLTIARAENAHCISAHAFYLERQAIRALASQLNYRYSPLSKKSKRTEKIEKTENKKYIWILDHTNKTVREQAVTVGPHDDFYYAVTAGIKSDEEYLTDIAQTSAMAAYYKKMFKGTM